MTTSAGVRPSPRHARIHTHFIFVPLKVFKLLFSDHQGFLQIFCLQQQRIWYVTHREEKRQCKASVLTTEEVIKSLQITSSINSECKSSVLNGLISSNSGTRPITKLDEAIQHETFHSLTKIKPQKKNASLVEQDALTAF
jgi:hypothetical protein